MHRSSKILNRQILTISKLYTLELIANDILNFTHLLPTEIMACSLLFIALSDFPKLLPLFILLFLFLLIPILGSVFVLIPSSMSPLQCGHGFGRVQVMILNRCWPYFIEFRLECAILQILNDFFFLLFHHFLQFVLLPYVVALQEIGTSRQSIPTVFPQHGLECALRVYLELLLLMQLLNFSLQSESLSVQVFPNGFMHFPIQFSVLPLIIVIVLLHSVLVSRVVIRTLLS